MSKKLAIVLVNWNSYELTKETLLSLEQSIYTDFDTIVVDNGSIDASADLLKKNFPAIILIQSATNKGFTGGNNIGMQYALEHGYEYIMMLNNDVLVDSHFLIPLMNTMEEEKTIGAVQPLIYFHHDTHLIWNAGSVWYPLWGICATPNYNRKDPVHAFVHQQKKIDWITGCAFLIRSSVLQEVGLLKEKFFIYYEDVDLSLRIKKAGYTLSYVPNSVIYHIAGMSQKSKQKGKEGFVSPKVHFLNARNRIWFLKEHTPFWAIPTVIVYHIFYFFGIGIYFIFRARWQKWLAWNKGIMEGLIKKLS